MHIPRAHAYPAPESSAFPPAATTVLSEQDKAISRFILPLMVSIAAHIFLPPAPAALVTVFCILSALAPGAGRPRIVIARRHFWNPLYVFHRPWTARVLVPQNPLLGGLRMDTRNYGTHHSGWSSSSSSSSAPTGQRLTGQRGADAPRDSGWATAPYAGAAPTNPRDSASRRQPSGWSSSSSSSSAPTGQRLTGQRARDLPRDQTGQTTIQGTPVNPLNSSQWIIRENPVAPRRPPEDSRQPVSMFENSLLTPPYRAVSSRPAYVAPPTGARLPRDGEETVSDAPRTGSKGTDSGWVTRKDS